MTPANSKYDVACCGSPNRNGQVKHLKNEECLRTKPPVVPFIVALVAGTQALIEGRWRIQDFTISSNKLLFLLMRKVLIDV